MKNEKLREELDYRQSSLFADTARQHFHNQCQGVTDYLLPHAGTLFARDESRVAARLKAIFDTEGAYCLDTATNGLVSYMAPPGGEWLGLLERDPDLAEIPAVKEWLAKLSARMLRMFGQSNTYDSLRLAKRDSLAFGGAVQIVDEDDTYTLWHHHVQAGEYALAANERGQPDTMYRELVLSVRQCRMRFGEENLSADTLKLWNEGPKSWDRPVQVYHAIEPRPDSESYGDDRPVSALDMPFRSVYWEAKSRKDEGVLRESGYRIFPVLCPRWDVIGNGLYGYGPGAMATPHIRSLQHRHHRLAMNIDWQTDPMKMMPIALRGQEDRFHPGGVLYGDVANPDAVRSVWENRTNLQHLLLDIEDVRKMVRRTFYTDAFLMFASIDRSNTTAAEIYERRQEKIDILGPQTARLFRELLRPLADIAFEYMRSRGQLPQPIPRELLERGAMIDPEFDSVLSQAAKSSRLAALDRTTSFALSMGQADPSLIHVFDTAAALREHAELTGVNPKLLRSQEQVDELAQAAAAQNAAMQQAAVAEQSSKTAKNEADAMAVAEGR